MTLTPQEIATELGLHPETVRRAIQRGELKAHRFGRRLRVLDSDYRDWLDQRRVVDAMPKPGRLTVVKGVRG